MKKLLSMTLVLAMIFSTLSLGALTASAAYSGTWGDLTWTLDEEGTLTISGEGEMDDPSYFDGDAWLSYADSIKTVVIESGVTTIGDDAFCSCYNLESTTIPDSVTIIGGNVFYNCTALESVTIPDSVTTIGDWAFDGCTALESVTIPDSVTTIGVNVFYNCTALKSIDVNGGNTAYCDVDGVLFNKDKTILIRYPVGKGGTSYTIPDSVTTIGKGAFDGCTALESVTIPDSVTTIRDSAFYYCTALESVTIPDSVATIGRGAFVWCTSLTSVTIPDSVTSISEWAFYDCSALENVYYCGSEEQWDKISIGSYNDPLLNANIIYNYIPEEPKGEKGDVNGDEYVDNADALVILKYDAGIIDLSDAELKAADVNYDGYADNADALMILKYDAGIIESFKTNYALGKSYTLTRDLTDTDPNYLYLNYSNGVTKWADVDLTKMTDGVVGDIANEAYAGSMAALEDVSVLHVGTNKLFEYVIDLGENYSDIRSIVFRNVRHGIPNGNNRGFKLRLAYVSDDGVNWSSLTGTVNFEEVIGAPEITSNKDENVTNVEHFDVTYTLDAPAEGRYVRLLLLSDNGYVIQLEEIEIWN